MAKGQRPRITVMIWVVCLVVCFILICGAVLLQTGIWKIRINFWLRLGTGLILILAGGSCGYFGSIYFFRSIVAWLPKGDLRVRAEREVKGPKIVVIGGGTGLGTILRGLKEITSDLTAIVTVADDGGSSGRLRQEFGILPPGDIRNCLVAMADLEPLMERLMQYRFTKGSGLAGHNFGNLFLAALTGVTGDFEAAIKESSKVLAVRGQVLPATLEHVTLKAELDNGSVIYGESNIAAAKSPIRQLFLDPSGARPVAEAVNAIGEAEVIILGPGSLYTSVIPNLLVGEITAAIFSSRAIKVYICNAMTEPGETEHYSASDHIRAVLKHTGPGLIDIAVVNTEIVPADILERYAEEGSQPVTADLERIRNLGITPLGGKIIVKSSVIRHDAVKLATMVLRLSRTQRLGTAFGRPFSRRFYRMFRWFSGVLFPRVG